MVAVVWIVDGIAVEVVVADNTDEGMGRGLDAVDAILLFINQIVSCWPSSSDADECEICGPDGKEEELPGVDVGARMA